MKTQATDIDIVYMRQWADKLAVRQVLEDAIEQTKSAP